MASKEIESEICKISNQLITAVQSRKNELLSEINKIPPECDGSSCLRFIVDDSLKSLCESFGSLTYSQVSPTKCHVSGIGQKTGLVDEASYIQITLVDTDGNECHDDVCASVFLVRNSTGMKCIGEKVRQEGDILTYRYVPLEPGAHMLHVKILDEHVRRSPFNVTVSMPLRMRCVPQIPTIKGFAKLGGVAVGPFGEIALVDTGGAGYKTVHVYNSNLELMMSFGGWGSGKGQCYYPIGITFDSAGNILVSDTSNHRIHQFDRLGQLIKTVGEKGRGPLQFSRPTGLAINKSGLVYVCDRDNNRIQILTPELEFNKDFGWTGDEKNNLMFPWDVAFDSQQDVYVVDAGHTCIKKFAPHGVYESQIGPVMKCSEKLQSPQMLCIDEYDYIYVTDYLRHEVIVFDTQGNYHTSFGGCGGAKGQFYQPRGIVKTKEGAIYVTDPGNSRLQIFQ